MGTRVAHPRIDLVAARPGTVKLSHLSGVRGRRPVAQRLHVQRGLLRLERCHLLLLCLYVCNHDVMAQRLHSILLASLLPLLVWLIL